MRRIRVTGGFSGEVEIRLTDSRVQDLELSEFKVGLIPLDAEIPAANASVWKTPAAEDYPMDGEAVLTIRPTVADGLGKFWPHVLVIDSGRDPELVRADDYVELT